MSLPRTLLDKIWDDHVVCTPSGELPLIYIDRHLVHEVTSPQAFEGLRLAGRHLRRPEATFATPDHNVPTSDRRLPIADPVSKQQIDTLRANCREFGVRLFDLGDADQGRLSQPDGGPAGRPIHRAATGQVSSRRPPPKADKTRLFQPRAFAG